MIRNPSWRLPGRKCPRPGRALLSLITALLLTVGFTSPSLAQQTAVPDLRVTKDAFGDIRPHQLPNVDFPVSLIVWNYGDADTPSSDPNCDPAATSEFRTGRTCPSTTLRVYSSADGTITTGDSLLTTRTVNVIRDASGERAARLNPNGTAFRGIMISLPSNGVFYIGACVDTVVGEAVTNNNCTTGGSVQRVEVQSYPDLAVSLANVTTNPAAGANFTLSATVQNVGAGTAAATTLRYYLAVGTNVTRPIPDFGAPVLETDAVGSLAAGASQPHSATVSIATAGTHYVSACADPLSNERPPNRPRDYYRTTNDPDFPTGRRPIVLDGTSNNCSDPVQVTVTAR